MSRAKEARAFRLSGGRLANAPLHYTQCGLDDIYLLNGFEHGAYKGKPWVSVTDMDGLYRAIGLNLVHARKSLSPKEWRFLRKQLGMTQAELGAELDLSSQQVARYEKGESEVSGPAELVLRILFLLSAHEGRAHEAVLRGLLDRMRKLRAGNGVPTRSLYEATRAGWRVAEAA